MLLFRWQRCYHEPTMTVQITIRNVPQSVRNELASRAALEGKSLQKYLLALLEETVAYPSKETLLQRIRERKRATGTSVSVEAILEARDSGRR